MSKIIGIPHFLCKMHDALVFRQLFSNLGQPSMKFSFTPSNAMPCHFCAAIDVA